MEYITYTDSNRTPSGVFGKYQVDLDIGRENDFEVQMNIQNHCMDFDSIWYVEGTEYGGVVDDVKLNTDLGIVYYTGRSFRGILAKKILQPSSGQDYYTVSGDANTVIQEVLERINVQDLFERPTEASGITITNYSFDRYTDAYTGLMKMLAKVGAKLKLTMQSPKVIIEAVEIEDLSEVYEYSDDYGMRIIFDQNHGGVNHLICLGQGELSQRQVVHLYVDGNGLISQNQTFIGLKEIAEIYDYPSVETLQELISSGTEKLQELKSTNTVSAQFEKLDVNVGDIVGGTNRMTGIKLKESVSALEISIKNGMVTVTYKIGDEM